MLFSNSRNSIPPTTTLENLKVKANIAKEEIYVDVGFWGGVVPGNEVKVNNREIIYLLSVLVRY